MAISLVNDNILKKYSSGTKTSIVNDNILSKYAPKKFDLNTVEGLAEKGKSIGLEDQVNNILDSGTPKLSVLQRLGKGLGAFNPAEAVMTGVEKQNVLSGVGKYFKGIGQGVASAITGTDYEGERRTFSEVAQKLGVTNTIAKFGIGVLGDIFLDPTTYFGGAIAKGLVKGASVGTNIALKTVGKVAPEVETGLRMAGKGLKDATGKAFVYGYGTSKGLPEKALEIQSTLSKAKEGIVASNLSRLGTQTLAPSQQEELVSKLMAGKRIERVTGSGEAGIKAAQSSDPLVQKTIQEQMVRSQKFAKQAGLNDPYQVYFPGLKNDSVKGAIEGGRSLRMGSQDYLKEFKDLITDEQLIRNPAEAFAKREVPIASDNIIRGELKGIVRDFGKPLTAFKSEEEAAKAGFRVLKEKGMFGKPIGYINEADSKFINNLISPEFSTIDAVAKATGFDALTSLFKRSVTGLFAPFHVRNYVSGLIQNFEVLGKDALNPKNIAIGQKIAYKMAKGESWGVGKTIQVAGKEIPAGRAMSAFERRFGNSSSYIADIADATKGAGNLPGKVLSKESLKTTAKTLGMGQQAIPFRVARGIGNFIETQQKATAYVTALSQGKTIQEALDLATRAGFDYRALTGFESKVLRRIIPFYSFTRKNIELQLRTLGENPQRIQQVLSTIQNLGELAGGERFTDEEQKVLPTWIKESLAIKFKDNPDGTKNILTGFGTPIEAFANLFKGSSAPTVQQKLQGFILGQISSMNPYLKVPVELGIGKDSFRQKDLKDVYSASEYSSAPQVVKDLLQLKAVQKPILTKNSAGKLVKTGERTDYVADPTRLLIARSLFTSRGVSYLDQVFDGDLSGLTKALKLTTGLKPQKTDLSISESIKERDQKRELQDLLLRYGAVSSYSRVY
jgi:hypothetical protein